MRKFDYRLEKVLKVRRIREGQVQAQMAREATFLQQRQQEKVHNQQQMDSHRALVVRKGPISAEDILYNADYVHSLEFKAERLEQIINASQQRVDGHKVALGEAKLETKKLETDRDNNKQQWWQELGSEEQKILDERNNARHKPKKKG